MIGTIDTIDKLEALAAWHRLNAEHAGSTWVWDARLRTAEDLERRAAELSAPPGWWPSRGSVRAGGVVGGADDPSSSFS